MSEQSAENKIEKALHDAKVKPEPIDVIEESHKLTIPDLYRAMGFGDHPELQVEQPVILDPLLERFIQLFEGLSNHAKVAVKGKMRSAEFRPKGKYKGVATLLYIIDILLQYDQLDASDETKISINEPQRAELEKLQVELKHFMDTGEVLGVQEERKVLDPDAILDENGALKKVKPS